MHQPTHCSLITTATFRLKTKEPSSKLPQEKNRKAKHQSMARRALKGTGSTAALQEQVERLTDFCEGAQVDIAEAAFQAKRARYDADDLQKSRILVVEGSSALEALYMDGEENGFTGITAKVAQALTAEVATQLGLPMPAPFGGLTTEKENWVKDFIIQVEDNFLEMDKKEEELKTATEEKDKEDEEDLLSQGLDGVSLGKSASTASASTATPTPRGRALPKAMGQKDAPEPVNKKKKQAEKKEGKSKEKEEKDKEDKEKENKTEAGGTAAAEDLAEEDKQEKEEEKDPAKEAEKQQELENRKLEHGRRAKTLAVAFLKFGTWMPGVARIEPNKTRWTWDDSEDTWKRAGGHFELYFGRVGKASMEVQTALLTLDPALAAAKKSRTRRTAGVQRKNPQGERKRKGKGQKGGTAGAGARAEKEKRQGQERQGQRQGPERRRQDKRKGQERQGQGRQR